MNEYGIFSYKKFSESKRHEFFCVISIGLIASIPFFYELTLTSLCYIFLNFMTAGITFLCLRNIWDNPDIGIVCSALYTLSVHRIFTLAVHDELKAGVALVFLPLVLYGLYGILRTAPEKDSGRRLLWLPLAIGWTGLLLSHIQTYEITILVVLLICICRFRKILNNKNFAELAQALIIHFLSAFIIIVVFRKFYELQVDGLRQMAVETIQRRGLYLLHLLCCFWNPEALTSIEGWDLDFSQITGMGFGLVAVIALFLALWFMGTFRDKTMQESMIFSKICACLSMLMMFMSLNSFPWDRIQTMNKITSLLVGSLQKPGYFLGWATLLAVTVFGCCLSHFYEKNKKLYWLCIVLAAADITASSLYLMDYAAAWRFM